MAGRNRLEYEIAAKDSSKGAVDSAKRGMKDLGEQSQGLGSKLGTVTKVAAGVTAGLIALKAAAQAVGRAFELAEMGAQFSQTQAAFRSMAQQVNQDANQLLDSMKRASAGTISEMELIASANRAMLFKIPTDKLEELMAIARASATATGASVQQMFDDIVTGIGRASPMILDNLGLTLKIGEANQAYADSLGKTVEELTGADRSQAILNATLEAGGELMERVGSAATELTDLERMQQFKAAWTDLKTAIGVTLADVFLPMVQAAADLATNMKDAVTQAKAWRDAMNTAAEERTGSQQALVLQTRIADITDQISLVRSEFEKAQMWGDASGLEQQLGQLMRERRALVQQLDSLLLMQGRAAEAQEHAAEEVAAWVRQGKDSLKIKGVGEVVPGYSPKGAFGISDKGLLDLTGFNDSLMTGYDLIMEFGGAIEEATKSAVKFSNKLDHRPGAGTAPTGYETDEASGVNALSGLVFKNPGGFNWDVLDTFTQALGSAVPQIMQLSSAAGVLSIMFKGFMDVVAPFVNGPLQILIGWLVQMGKVIGTLLAPWLEVLSNLYQALGRVLVWLYNNVFLYIGNAIIAVIKGVVTILWAFAQAVTNVVNGLIKIYNAIRRESKELDYVSNPIGTNPPAWDSGWLTPITLDDLVSQGIDAGGTWNTGTSANYTTGRTINQTITINTDVIAGEGGIRQLALIIRDEIYAAEALGV